MRNIPYMCSQDLDCFDLFAGQGAVGRTFSLNLTVACFQMSESLLFAGY